MTDHQQDAGGTGIQISAVGFAAMLDSKNEDGIPLIIKADAIIADAEPQLRWFHVLKTFDIALACGKIARHALQDIKRSGPVNGAKVGFGLICPFDRHRHGCWPGATVSSGVRPIRSKSSAVRPKSARISSLGMPLLCLSHSLEAVTARVSSSLISSSS